MHIFISYAKKDTRELAIKIHVALNAISGVTAWMDKSLRPGTGWAQQIKNEINKCDCVIVLYSPDVNRSADSDKGESFVINEIQHAQRKRKPIIPIMAEETDPPIELASVQYIDFTRNHDEGMQLLIEEIIRRAGQEIVVQQQKSKRSIFQKLFRPPSVFGVALVSVFVIGLIALVSIVQLQKGQFPTPNRQAIAAQLLTSTIAAQTLAAIPTATPTLDETQAIAEIITEIVLTETSEALATVAGYTFTPSPTPTSTQTPTENLALTAYAQSTIDFQVTASTTSEQATQIAQLTANAPTNTLRPTSIPTITETSTATLTSPPSVTSTHTPDYMTRQVILNATLTQVAESTRIFEAARATADANIPRVTVNTASANLRNGPGTNYAIVGSAIQGQVFEIVAQTYDSTWYLIDVGEADLVWISVSVIVVNSNTTIPIAATIPPLSAGDSNIVEDNQQGGVSLGNCPAPRLFLNRTIITVEAEINVFVSLDQEAPNRQLLTTLGTGSLFTLIGGPYCVAFLPSEYYQESYGLYWRVRVENGSEGYTLESARFLRTSDGQWSINYWIDPSQMR